MSIATSPKMTTTSSGACLESSERSTNIETAKRVEPFGTTIWLPHFRHGKGRPRPSWLFLNGIG